ncbi:MAG: hypothetical protein ACI8QC_001477 [Planctomycetota bacterium]|jgi:uncharacterized protein (DUF1501 family)
MSALNPHTRRQFLSLGGAGVGAFALHSPLSQSLLASQSDGRWRGIVNPLHHAPKAKRVIYLYMAGGPSHLESFDYKPKLAELDGKPMPESLTMGQPVAQLQGQELTCRGPQVEFQRHGQSGQEISAFFPHIAGIADDMTIVRSMLTEQINHDPAHTFINTGSRIPGHPSMGAWINYGIGSESDNLPGFVVLSSVGGGQAQPIASRQWQAAYLPSEFQGVKFRSTGDPVSYVGAPAGASLQDQRDIVSAIQRLNAMRNDAVSDPEIAARISQYEMAFRMHSSVPELTDLSDEPKHIMDLYGTEGADGSFAANCLLARRMAERGVRFIQLYHRGWDHHSNLQRDMPTAARLVDQASAALVHDLKQRGMLDDTIVIWGGEFGRTPMAQGSGRDHHIKGFSMWMAGGGFKGGTTYGETDELGYNALPDSAVHVRDLHATLLHQLGIDHDRLRVKFQGLDQGLTGVEHARVVHEIIT